jgi:hypothetical protein
MLIKNMLLCAALALSIGGAAACERAEYARLKDSSRKELIATHCDAQLSADTQAKIVEANKAAFAQFVALGDMARAERASKDRSAASATRLSCLRVAREAEDMLRKKFGAKPNCR